MPHLIASVLAALWTLCVQSGERDQDGQIEVLERDFAGYRFLLNEKGGGYFLERYAGYHERSGCQGAYVQYTYDGDRKLQHNSDALVVTVTRHTLEAGRKWILAELRHWLFDLTRPHPYRNPGDPHGGSEYPSLECASPLKVGNDWVVHLTGLWWASNTKPPVRGPDDPNPGNWYRGGVVWLTADGTFVGVSYPTIEEPKPPEDVLSAYLELYPSVLTQEWIRESLFRPERVLEETVEWDTLRAERALEHVEAGIEVEKWGWLFEKITLRSLTVESTDAQVRAKPGRKGYAAEIRTWWEANKGKNVVQWQSAALGRMILEIRGAHEAGRLDLPDWALSVAQWTQAPLLGTSYLKEGTADEWILKQWERFGRALLEVDDLRERWDMGQEQTLAVLFDEQFDSLSDDDGDKGWRQMYGSAIRELRIVNDFEGWQGNWNINGFHDGVGGAEPKTVAEIDKARQRWRRFWEAARERPMEDRREPALRMMMKQLEEDGVADPEEARDSMRTDGTWAMMYSIVRSAGMHSGIHCYTCKDAPGELAAGARRLQQWWERVEGQDPRTRARTTLELMIEKLNDGTLDGLQVEGEDELQPLQVTELKMDTRARTDEALRRRLAYSALEWQVEGFTGMELDKGADGPYATVAELRERAGAWREWWGRNKDAWPPEGWSYPR